jgi:hypothetical protein
MPVGLRPPWVKISHLPGYRLGVDGADDALAAELVGGARDHVGVGHGGGVEADLVRASQQQRAHILDRAHAAADGQRHEALLGRAGGEVIHRAPVLMGRVDVEKAQLIRARRVIGLRLFHRIARIAQVDEVHALDHAAVGDVETGDDAGLEHGAVPSRSIGGGEGRQVSIFRIFGKMKGSGHASAASAVPRSSAPS